MAIRRCPYCKAIIDEGSEYCSNCGTQLLFPEDEFIEEEIPGEKIIDEDIKEEGNPKKEKRSSSRRKKKDQVEEVELLEEEEEAEEEKEEESEEEMEEEMKAGPKEGNADVEKEAKEVGEKIDEDKPTEADYDEFFIEPQDPAFGADDIEKVLDPEEKEKVEIEKFLKSLKEDREEWNGEVPPTDELPPWAEKIKDKKPEGIPSAHVESEVDEKEPEEPEDEPPLEGEAVPDEVHRGEELPVEEPQVVESEEEGHAEEVPRPMGLTPEDEVPEIQIPEEAAAEEEIVEGEMGKKEVEAEIAAEIDEEREEAVEEIEAELDDAAEGEEKPVEECPDERVNEKETVMPDTGMGLPEGVEQERLPFIDKSTGEFDEDEESSPSKVPSWLKSRAFDVLFIAALWFVALHIASRMMSTNLFKLISISALQVFAFYIALLTIYLFLFFLFLGQTLGDHLFPYEE